MPAASVDKRGRPLKGTRRPLGAGTITERRPGYFVVRLRAGVDEAGRPRVLRRAGRATIEDARQWLAEMGAVAPPPPPEARRQRPPTVQRHPFSVEPLLADRGGNVRALARTVGVSREAVLWRRQTGLSADEADEWAMACGLHPVEVWGDLWA